MISSNYMKKSNNLRPFVLAMSLMIGCTFLSSCTSQKFTVSQVKQGKQLHDASKATTSFYLNVFVRKDEKTNTGWAVLYTDSTNIYFGDVIKKGLFTKEETLTELYKIPIVEMERDIPLWRADNLQEELFFKIMGYVAPSYSIYADGIDVTIVNQNDSVTYRMEGVDLLALRRHFNLLDLLPFRLADVIIGKGHRYKVFIITDSNFNILKLEDELRNELQFAHRNFNIPKLED